MLLVRLLICVYFFAKLLKILQVSPKKPKNKVSLIGIGNRVSARLTLQKII